MEQEETQLSHREQATFRHSTQGANTEIQPAIAPTDGWDPTPRETEFELLSGDRDLQTQRVRIPAGHIAMKGGFDTPPTAN
jgi:hypothetical protein